MFTNVIAGVDGRDGGCDAAVLAAALGSGHLTLLCAYPPGHRLPGDAGIDGGPHAEDARAHLEDADDAAGAEAELTAVADRSPARALHDAAERTGADLLVVGSAHHGPLGRVLLGDVGRALVHGAPCPVAIAPKGCDREPPRRIAVGFDGTPESRAALQAAIGLTEEGGALTVYVVWEDPPVPVAVTAGSSGYIGQARDSARSAAEELLAATLDELPARVAGHVLHGRPDIQLEHAADAHDLLVVGSRGWGPARRLALGSTSDRLVHRAPIPVLVVPRPSADPAAATPETTAASTA